MKIFLILLCFVNMRWFAMTAKTYQDHPDMKIVQRLADNWLEECE